MLRELNIQPRSLPLNAPFRIARGTSLTAEVVRVELAQDGHTGRGEAAPSARYGQSVDAVVDQVESLRETLCAGMGRDELQAQLPPGSARNALDAALWDLESRLTGVPVWAALARAPHQVQVTAFTVGIDTAEKMGAAAARIADKPLLKVKLDARDIAARIEAVHAAAPDARLIVDANEAWDIHILADAQGALEKAGVELIEQPMPAGADDALGQFQGRIPICADEACHTSADLPHLAGRYQAINIKLEKTGGLTEAWRLLHAARAAGFTIMVGCMVSSSLSMAPALEIAREAAFVDLDGPFWLEEDYCDGINLGGGMLHPPRPGFWGG